MTANAATPKNASGAEENKKRVKNHESVKYRFLVCGNYIAYYREDETAVYVVRILYGGRDYVKILFGK